MLNYNVGDKLVIKDVIKGHKFKLGEEVVVRKMYPNHSIPHYSVKSINTGKIYAVIDDEVARSQHIPLELSNKYKEYVLKILIDIALDGRQFELAKNLRDELYEGAAI